MRRSDLVLDARRSVDVFCALVAPGAIASLDVLLQPVSKRQLITLQQSSFHVSGQLGLFCD